MIIEKRDYLHARVAKELWPKAVCLNHFISNTNVDIFFSMVVDTKSKDISHLALPSYLFTQSKNLQYANSL